MRFERIISVLGIARFAICRHNALFVRGLRFPSVWPRLGMAEDRHIGCPICRTGGNI